MNFPPRLSRALCLLFGLLAGSLTHRGFAADEQGEKWAAGAAEPALSKPDLETFEQRRRVLLETFAEDGSDRFTQAECLFILGRSSEALAEVNRGLDALVPGNKVNRWMHGGNTGFLVWPGIDCYIRFEKLMDAATKERYRKIDTGGVFYAKLSTSNHKAGMAGIAYEVCLVQLAPAWLRGHLATFAPRSYPDTECQQRWGLATLPWLYFGGVASDLRHANAAVGAAVSSYRAPALIVDAANDRSTAYFYRAVMDGWALDHDVNRTYVLFSRSAKVGGRPFQGQSYPCGVMWEDPDPAMGSHLWITNPAADKPGGMGIHTHGVTSAEEEILRRDSLLFLFQIGPEGRFPYASGYVTGGYCGMINDSEASGRIFMDYGNVLIAVTASQPFEWEPGAGIYPPAAKPRAGDSEFRVRAPICAVAIETAPPDDYPGAPAEERLAKFGQAIMTKSALRMEGQKPAAASYRNRYGDIVSCTYGGANLVNGKTVDYKNWPVSGSPWTSQKVPKKPLVMTDRTKVRIYDVDHWTVEDGTK
jgi:hypothetical protein